MNLDGKTAVVFGATGAIGSTVSRRLAAEGARVLSRDDIETNLSGSLAIAVAAGRWWTPQTRRRWTAGSKT